MSEQTLKAVCVALMRASRPGSDPNALVPAPRGHSGFVPQWTRWEHLAKAAIEELLPATKYVESLEDQNARLVEALTAPPAWKEIDLSKSVKHEHPDISTDKQYLVKVYGGWFFGRFTRQWYGLSFSNWGTSGAQFDAPGFNSSRWERVIEIDPEAMLTGREPIQNMRKNVSDNGQFVSEYPEQSVSDEGDAR